MTHITNPHQAPTAQRDNRRRSKRGSVLVLAVGVLAVLAVMALSYVSVVRIDRRSTAAYQEDENLQQQVLAATAYIQSLLAADIFGNIIVNNATPPANVIGRPKAFIDGGYSDIPWTDLDPTRPGNTFTGARFTFDTQFPTPSNPRPDPDLDARLNLHDPNTNDPNAPNKRPFADDAWLASLDPADTGSGEWDTWPQITNLLSAYRWVKTNGFAGYARDNGLFVDLGQLLLQPPLGFTGSGPRPGNPGAFLHLDRNNNLWQDPFTGLRNGPHLAINQNIFDLQMSDLQEAAYWPAGVADPGPGRRKFQPADERFWADTDGDGRPDARWQQLPILGNAFGKVWVIAARIVDNSAQANVNAHLHFVNDYQNIDPNTIGDGRTPADIDIFRLFASQLPGARIIDPNTGILVPSAHPDILRGGVTRNEFSRTGDGAGAWKFHLDEGLRIADALEQIDRLNDGGNDRLRLNERNTAFLNTAEPFDWPGGGAGSGVYNGQPGSNPLALTRTERAAYWRYAGSFGRGALATSARPYPIRDEIDLRTYFGFNHLGVISRLEQRLDGPIPVNPETNGFLRGTGPAYTNINNPGLGLLRSKEFDNLTDSPRTFNNSFALELSPGSYTNNMKLERLRKDIRRYLTTVSGSGGIGPVPVLNPADRFKQQFSTRKVDLNRFATPSLSVTAASIRDPLREAYEAVVWALAPFATNRPLMAPLDQIEPAPYAQLARNADLHYGGGPNGPAREIATRYGLTASTPGGGSPDEIGAAYALVTAASLALNLTDAIDSETIADTSTPTIETPTIARLFNQPDLDFFLDNNPGTIGATLRSDLDALGVIPLGVRFPHGDINSDSNDNIIANFPTPDTAALPIEILGEPQNGVTLVGLDRQPFLVHAYSAVFYANSNAVAKVSIDPNDDMLDPTDPRDLLGSFFAFELGNPWTEPIDLRNYSVQIIDGAATPARTLIFSFTGANITGGAEIFPGTRATFYFFSDVSPDLAAAVPPGLADAEWTLIKDEIVAAMGGAGNDVRLINPSTNPMVPTFEGTAYMSNSINIFEEFGANPSLPVLLTRQVRAGTSSIEVLVDRLSPTTPSDVFPISLDNAVDLNFVEPVSPTFTGTPIYAGRAAVFASVRRPDDISTSGFPSYVVERPSDNIVGFDQDDTNSHGWIINDPANSPEKPVTDITDVIAADEIRFLNPATTGGALNLPPFELFVPNTPLVSTAELGLISTFTHMYIHPDQAPPSIANAWDTSGNLGPGKWVTISEQLGWDEHINYDSQAAPGSALNPYLGVLDFSRYIPGSSATGGDLDDAGGFVPDQLAVPLAARVFDAFEAIPTPDATGLVRGRVNINTAPRRVLELLPLIDPIDPLMPGSPMGSIGGWSPALDSVTTPGATRVDWIDRYRKRHFNAPGPGLPITDQRYNSFPADQFTARNAPQNHTTLPGLRNPTNLQTPWSPGLVAAGELAVMGQWGPDGSVVSSNSGFLELGANGNPNDAIPLDLRAIATGFEAIDDPEERLALYRALANIVSTRSDIFTAWYILRAYDPLDIESITIDTSIANTDEKIVDLMNPGSPFTPNPGDHRGLVPTFERRILVIFDRSNVRNPTDRPRILLQVELPLN